MTKMSERVARFGRPGPAGVIISNGASVRVTRIVRTRCVTRIVRNGRAVGSRAWLTAARPADPGPHAASPAPPDAAAMFTAMLPTRNKRNCSQPDMRVHKNRHAADSTWAQWGSTPDREPAQEGTTLCEAWIAPD